MNPVFTRLQALRQKAAQLKQAVDSAPAKAAQFRDAVNSTAGQLHQLRADVQGTVAALKSDTDTSLAETLVELDGGVGILARAGYELSGVDLEQGVTPRLIVHLDQLDLARTESLESLLRECAGRRTLQAIFQALIRAEALEEKVQLADLSFRGLIVHVRCGGPPHRPTRGHPAAAAVAGLWGEFVLRTGRHSATRARRPGGSGDGAAQLGAGTDPTAGASEAGRDGTGGRDRRLAEGRAGPVQEDAGPEPVRRRPVQRAVRRASVRHI
jgi:hypothetical protein